VGTRFVCAKEAGAPPFHQNAIIKAGYHDTIRTLIFTGRPLRVLNTDYIAQWEERQNEIKELTSKVFFSLLPLTTLTVPIFIILPVFFFKILFMCVFIYFFVFCLFVFLPHISSSFKGNHSIRPRRGNKSD
jgi:Nitronate monooxygenase